VSSRDVSMVSLRSARRCGLRYSRASFLARA
jgi:hypothetical protein